MQKSYLKGHNLHQNNYKKKATLKPPEKQEAEKLFKRIQFSSKQLEEQKKKLKTPKKQKKREKFLYHPGKKLLRADDLILHILMMNSIFLTMNRIGKPKEAASLMKLKN